MLLEAPSLPQRALRQFLEQLAAAGPEWCTLALLAARDAIERRPPSRAPLLALVLDACASSTSDTRGKAVRLVANRLFPNPGMAPIIEQAARRRLDAMLPPQPPAAAAVSEAAAAAAACSPAAAGAENVDGPAPSSADAPEPEKSERAEAAVAVKREAADVATAASNPEAQAAAAAGDEEQAQAAAAAAAPTAGEQQGRAAAAAAAGEAQEQAAAAAAAGKAQDGASAGISGPSAAEAAQLCALYCALCTKKHSLLRRLFEVYAQTSGAFVRAVLGLQLGAAVLHCSGCLLLLSLLLYC